MTDTRSLPLIEEQSLPFNKVAVVLIVRIIGLGVLAAAAGMLGYEYAWHKDKMETLVNGDVFWWIGGAIFLAAYLFWCQKKLSMWNIAPAFVLAVTLAYSLKDTFNGVYWSDKLTLIVIMALAGLILSAADHLVKLLPKS